MEAPMADTTIRFRLDVTDEQVETIAERIYQRVAEKLRSEAAGLSEQIVAAIGDSNAALEAQMRRIAMDARLPPPEPGAYIGEPPKPAEPPR